MLNTDLDSAVAEADASNSYTAHNKRAERVALTALVALYLACAYGFAVVTPYGEAPDEYSHLLYIEHLVSFGELPRITKDPYTAEAFQPPLYYMGGALIVAAGRMLTGKRLDAPLAPPVRVRPEREPGIDLAVMFHPPEERWPFTVYALRAYSILLGLGVVLLTYATARTLLPWPTPATVPLLATTFAALVPQANSIRASISSESMADLTGALIVWLLVLHLMRPHSVKRVFWIGVALGLAFLTKWSVIPLILPVAWVLWVRREGERRRFLQDLAVVGGLALLAAGWLYVFRWVAYGDPLASGAMRAMVPPDGVDDALGDFFWFQEPFREMLWTSFWGVYGWQLVFMPEWVYNVFLAGTILALAGGVLLIVRRALSRVQQAGAALFLSVVLLLYAFTVQISTYVMNWQGRQMYPALSSVCVLLGLGLGGLVLGRGAVQPVRVSAWRFALSQSLVAAVALSLLALNISSILWLVLPALNP